MKMPRESCETWKKSSENSPEVAVLYLCTYVAKQMYIYVL